MIEIARQMAIIAFWLFLTALFVGGCVCVYLGVRKAARREIQAERDEWR
jgi:hypothetical protein